MTEVGLTGKNSFIIFDLDARSRFQGAGRACESYCSRASHRGHWTMLFVALETVIPASKGFLVSSGHAL